MCGLNITIGLHNDVIYQMNNAIKHRGIRSNVIHHGNFSMGHVRLPVQGLDKFFDQPYNDDSMILGYVGEIFNIEDIFGYKQQDMKHLVDKFQYNNYSDSGKQL